MNPGDLVTAHSPMLPQLRDVKVVLTRVAELDGGLVGVVETLDGINEYRVSLNHLQPWGNVA
jgi:hypothetical protein